jgi:hypothetical protein
LAGLDDPLWSLPLWERVERSPLHLDVLKIESDPQ